MFLSKLTVEVRSRDFRRDHANIHDMHRTVMSAFPEVPDDRPARQAHGVLWRLDGTHDGFVQYVQSCTEPDWSRLPDGYAREAQVRSLQPVLDSITGGRRLAFRLVANPTRTIHPDDPTERRGHGKRVPHRKPEKQVEWLVRKGEEHGFVIPTGMNGEADVAPSPCPLATGRKTPGEQEENEKKEKGRGSVITIEPVRFDGHLIVTDPERFTAAVVSGIGRAKAYGCGLVSLAPAQRG